MSSHNKLTREEVQKRLKEKGFELIGEYVDGHTKTLVKCHCSKEYFSTTQNLFSGHTKSCGCLDPKRFVDYKGQRFGRLLVLEEDLERKCDKLRRCWICKCDCGKIISTTSTRLKSRDTASCGCLHKEVISKILSDYAKTRIGPLNPAYKQELNEEDRINRRCLKQNDLWVEQVFKRDNYTCVKCGKRGGDLHAHHINSYHWCKEQRFDVNNGATLCKFHHKDFHKKFGQKNNTKIQFDEYRYGL